ncbi:MAG: transcriptional regulator [Euryarchaeota archaeon]|nr:transcriptional regulator [Euryarchaeota archaeon]
MAKEFKLKFPEKEDFDDALVSLVQVLLDTETKAKIYIFLRKHGPSQSREIAKGANLHPSSVRQALMEMTKAGILDRRKMEVEGAGKRPYIYEAISPVELVRKKAGAIEEVLNKVSNLDERLMGEKKLKRPRFPYRIRIERQGEDEGQESEEK